MQVIFVALAQFRADLIFGPRHIVNRSFHRNDTLQIEAIDVIDGANRDFGVRVLHDAFDGVAALANDATNQIIVRKDFQHNFTSAMAQNNEQMKQMPIKWFAEKKFRLRKSNA